MSHTFSDAGVSSVIFVKTKESFSCDLTLSEYSEGVSEEFDGRLFLERSDNGGLSWETVKPVTVDGAEVNYGKDASYRMRCKYSAAQEVDLTPELTGTAEVEFTIADEVVAEFKTKDGNTIAKITENGLDATSITEGGVSVATTEDIA